MSASAVARAVVTRHHEGRVAVLVYDTPDTDTNVLTLEAFADLEAHLADIAADDAVVGAVLASAKPAGFCAGFDLARLGELASLADPLPTLEQGHRVVRALIDSPKPVVAALHGAALGGGLELALACHERVATSDEATVVGLPQVTLGLSPATGGTQTLPRLAGSAGVDHLLRGTSLQAAEAANLGLVDDVVPKNQLRRIATARAAEASNPHRLRDDRSLRAFADADLDALVEDWRASARRRAKGIWPAPEAIVDAVEAGLRNGFDAGLGVERERFARLLATDEAAARLHLAEAEKAARTSATEEARRVSRLFVLGGGMMGSGLAAHAIDRGLAVRVRDVSSDALVGVRRHADRFLRSRYERHGTDFARLYRERIHRLSTTTDLSGVATADAVIEAVFERTDLKQEVMADTEARMAGDAIFASNTSAIPIASLAEAASRPERVIGMHFFSPVERMPLVEIIPHAQTSAATLATALRLALDLDKSPVVVGDAPGFYTTRVYGRWLAEAARLLLAGARIDEIDAAATAVGFPVGPMIAYDEIGIELAAQVATDPQHAPLTAQRLDLSQAQRALRLLVAAGHHGRRAQKGFYIYSADNVRQGPDEAVPGIVGAAGDGVVTDEELRERLVWSFVTEALLCYEEGLLRSTRDGDLAAVSGIGFPANLGGPFFHVDRTGPAEALSLVERLDAPEPGAFSPSPTLRTLARAGGRFAEQPGGAGPL